MKASYRIVRGLVLSALVLYACSSLTTILATQTAEPTPTVALSPTPRPERNIALGKPVKVSASWVVDPPEKAVNGNRGDWWGAGGPAPQWIEVDLGGLYSISRIRIINQGPTGEATFRVIGRGADNASQLLHEFTGTKSENQTLEFAPAQPWQAISAIRIEILNGSGWVGFREIEVYSREDPEPLKASAPAATPLFMAGIQPEALQRITPDNAASIQPLAMFGRGTINELAWSPDGKTLAAAGTLGIWLYDAAAPDSPPRLLEGHTRDVLGVAFSADGSVLYSGSQDGTVKQWNVAAGELRQTFPLWNDFSYEVGSQKRDPEVWSLAFSPDRKSLAAGSLDGSLRVWSLQIGRQAASMTGHTKEVTSLAFSPDGTILASSGYDGRLFLWDAANGSKRATLSGHQGPAVSLVFSPDGKTIASGGNDQTIRLWDAQTGGQVATLNGHTDQVTKLAFSPDGQMLASNAADGTLRFWDVKSGKELPYQGKFFGATSMVFSPDGSTLATSTSYGMIELWDAATGRELGGTLTHTSAVTSIAFSPNNAALAAGGNDGLIRLWDVRRNELLGALAGSGGITGVAFSPDGGFLAASGMDGRVTLWDMQSGKPFAVFTGHRGYVRCVAISPDGKLGASGGTDRTVRLWDPATGKELGVLTGHNGEVESVAFSPDGASLLSASADNVLRIWDVKTQKLSGVLKGHQSYVLSGAFSPDGTQIASGSGDHSLRVWTRQPTDAAGSAGTLRFPPIGHGGWVLSVAFSPDGSMVASGGVSTTSYVVAPGEIHVYSAESGFPYALLRGHTKRVTSVVFSSDGKLLASGSADGSVRLWGVAAGASPPITQPTAQPLTPTTQPTSAAPTPTAQPTRPPSTPTVTPDLPKSGNLALNRVTSASHSEAWRPSRRAVDGDMTKDWGSGEFPPQWIQIDLGAPATIQEIRLLVTQDPNGNTVHRILVGAANGKLSEIHRFEGFTRSGQWLDYKLEQPLQNVQIVRIETLKSPSWVGWVEIEVLGRR